MLNSFWWGAKGENRKGIRWMSWERLTMRKEWGGMGFRSIHGFNIAMLGKQGWNFLTKPDAMVSRVFKAKYFPNGDFLGSSLGHNPSYVWRSIWSSRIVLREGYRWRIGDGSKIPIWHTPWLRDERNPCITTPNNNQVEGDWNQLWTLPIPPKVKHFMWRLGRDCLPNRQRLLSKGVECQSNCVVCQEYNENNWHTFLCCADSATCWRKIQLWNNLNMIMQQAESFKEVFVKLWSNLNQTQLVSFSMTAWSIWQKRNIQLWENKKESPDKVIARAQGTLQAWQQAQTTVARSVTAEQQRHAASWQPPHPEFVKCNIDAAIFSTEKKIGMGACVRDATGRFIIAMSSYINGVMTPAEGEAWALQQGITWMAMLGYQKVCFELDCKTVVEDIHSISVNHSEYG
ncbi:RNA-directed DNA polymerase (Reverse transcriptase), partial [Trifolium medium]|nr:RNA-directed DNA polymerase (Reverse transcriptase) [Trifolium medium]